MKTEPSYTQLDYQERQTITISRQQGLSIRAIASVRDRSPSTTCREITRNAPGPSYSCRFAQQRCDRRRRFADLLANSLQAARCLSASQHCFASAGHPSKLPPIWLNFT